MDDFHRKPYLEMSDIPIAKNSPPPLESDAMNIQEGVNLPVPDLLNGYDGVKDLIKIDKEPEQNKYTSIETLGALEKQQNQSEMIMDPNIVTQNEDILSDLNEVSSIHLSQSIEAMQQNKFEENETMDEKRISMDSMDEKKIANLRRNIRDVIDEKQLDTNTIAAQREESERLARVAEQQKIIREYQRQTAVNRQFVRTQNKVLSLLQNGSAFAKVTDLTEECTTTDQEPVENDNECNINVNSNIVPDELNKKHTTESADDNLTKVSISENEPSVANDIVTIEDSSSEDDCILLSDDEEDIEEETEDDPNNSGLHVKDVYNVPDEYGRVVVNIGHPEGEDDIFIAPQIARTIKPHQIGGVRFLFDNIIESTKRFKNSGGFGCILAHSMGLGKTLQIVCFCDIFLRHTLSKTVLCVMPINTLQNWVAEFNMWTPRFSQDPDHIRPREFDIFILNDQQKTLSARAKVVLQWAEKGGVLLMGYEMFRMLALKIVPTRKRRTKNCLFENTTSDSNKRLLENIHQVLVKPGPDLVICDEGHRIKNAHAGISVALKQIRTRRRIVLTGYPLQNNLLEYWCMVDFVRPNYLGTRTEFCNMFERPIQNGQCIDSTPEDIKLMRYRAHVLHSLLVGFVQRRSHLVLQQTLPQKLEYVILTRMTLFQRQLYDTFMNDVVRSKAVPNPLKAFAVCCKIWNHPDVLYNYLKKRETDLDLEIDDTEPTTIDTNPKTSTAANISSEQKSAPKSGVAITIPESVTPISQNTYPNNTTFNSTDTSSKALFSDSNEQNSTGEIRNRSRSHEKVFYPDNYFNQNNGISPYPSDCNGNIYGQETNFSYFAYPTTPSNMGYSSSKPDYVGMMVKQPQEQAKNELKSITSSSELVDLDTKEIKTVETDFNMNSNPVIENEFKMAKATINEEVTENSTTPVQQIIQDNKSPHNSTLSEKDIKMKNDDCVPYEWAADLMKKYEPGLISNSPKMEIFFCILRESIELNDRVLLFSQSLLTLNLIEQFLQANQIPNDDKYWTRNTSYFRLDGSTASQDREKLVNEFNVNTDIKLFLISTKAGSLGINLVGANRVIVFDASWNPCHDTQAVYRIYRYGQEKPCYVYRIVMDKCLEKKIYDRQIKKQGMSDRVVDEANPDAHLSMKDVTNLCHDYDDERVNDDEPIVFSQPLEAYLDTIIQKILQQYKSSLSKEPFYHDSLLIDRKEKKLSQAEKRQAHRGYEMEKKASIKHTFTYSTNKMQYRVERNHGGVISKPSISASVIKTQIPKGGGARSTRWIPAEVWQRQGMTAQEMTLPMDVVIPTNSTDKSNIILKAGQRVMVLKSTKGIYMQLDSGKIIAIRTSSKASEVNKSNKTEVIDITSETDNNSDANLSTKIANSSAADKVATNPSTATINTVPPQRAESTDQITKDGAAQSNCEDATVMKEYPNIKPIHQQPKMDFQTTTTSRIMNSTPMSQNRDEVNNVKKFNSSQYTTTQMPAQKQKHNEKNSLDIYHKRKKSNYFGRNPVSSSEISQNAHPSNVVNTLLGLNSEMNYEHQRKEIKKSYPDIVNNESNSNYNRDKKDILFSKDGTKHKSPSPIVAFATNDEPPNNKIKLNSSADTSPVPANIGYYGAVPSQDVKQALPPSLPTVERKTTTEYVQNTFANHGNGDNKLQRDHGNNQTEFQPPFQSNLQHQHGQLNNIESSRILPYPMYTQQQQYSSQHKFPLYMPPYNLQHSQYNSNPSALHNNVTQNITVENGFPANSYFVNRETPSYTQYCDNMYSNNSMQTSCDYSGQLNDYHAYNSYNHQPYHSHFHANSYGSTPTTAMSPHPYVHWSPLVSPSSLIEQRNTIYPSTYSQNGHASEHWHHQ